MRPPGNILYIIQGEMSILLTAMRRGPRWSGYSSQDESQDSLLKAFAELKVILSHTEQWDDLDPSTVITPFLNVIRDNDTPGPVTGLALGAVNKLLSYHIIDPSLESAPAVMESIADAVTHARFVGTETSSDEVVLVKILQVLRTLLMIPSGCLLSNESVCEIMQSCFRLCFEPRLSELLRRSAEHILTDLTQLLFTRLADMSEDDQSSSSSRKLKMRSGSMDGRGKKKGKFPRLMKYRRRQTDAKETAGKEQAKDGSGGSGPAKKPDNLPVEPAAAAAAETSTNDEKQPPPGTASDRAPLATTPGVPKGAVVDLNHLDRVHVPETVREVAEEGPPVVPPSEGTGGDPPAGTDDAESLQEETADGASVGDAPQMDESLTAEQLPAASGTGSETTTSEPPEPAAATESEPPSDGVSVVSGTSAEPPADETEDDYPRENPQGVKFTGRGRGSGPLLPYGLPCVREVLNFFASLTCPMDRNNSDFMIHCGLGLLAVAMETGADQMSRLPSLISLVRDDICRNLFSLLNSERLSIFSAALRCCLLVFESLRGEAKFQLEMYVTRLTDIVVSENPRTAYEQKEMALDALVQLWKVPGLVTELYLNYDCDPYCSNLFEDVTKLLSKNAFPVQGVYSTHLLSLDALLTIVDSIEHQCHTRIHASEMRTKSESSTGDASASPAADALSGPAFPASGYLVGCNQPRTPPPADVATSHWPSRRPPIDQSLVPTHEELMAVKHKKKLLASGTEHFNAKPAKGIQFLQDSGLLSSPLQPLEVVHFIKENPRLDKKMIGEYISNRKNLTVLDAFVKSFDFCGLRVDESLRLYLETFRLPGEAPVISLLMEHFADHWHKSNDEPFANADAAFTLAYAIIMLNVDQHNHNVRKNTVPMTRDDFKRNLKKVNGGNDFNQEMLDEIYTAIKSEEIVMPAEQTGLVRENYLWKVLLRRGAGRDGRFVRTRGGTFDHDLFSLSWGPTVAALSFVFDRSSDEMIVQKAIGGFRKCAMIAAHYGMTDVYDNLVISLCKFTTLGTSAETPESLVISFGANTKAQLATRTVFSLTHRHGDILRDGWRNLLDCLLQLYRCRLLSTEVTEAEDFLSPTGRVSLFREPVPVAQRPETGLLSSLYSYIALGAAESPAARQPTPEDLENKARAQRVIRECQPEQLITESKFLRMDSLQELVKALILASHGPDGPVQGSSFDEDSASFFLEILIKVVIQNRDRAAPLWQSVRNHIYSVVMSASASHHNQLMERGIVGLIRLVIRLVRREELTCQVLQSLRMLLLLRGSCLQLVCRQAAAGLHELLRSAAGSVTSAADWTVLFTLLECVGAGARPPAVMAGHAAGGAAAGENGGGISDVDPGTASDGTADSGHASEDKCYSDSELYEARGQQQTAGAAGRLQSAAPYHSMSDLSVRPPTTATGGGGGGGGADPPRAAGTGGWILVGKEGELEPLQMRALPLNQFNITHDRDLLFHDPVAFAKSAESLSLLIRDAAHVTAANFAPCVQCLRTYVEASLNGRQHHAGAGRSTGTTTGGGGGGGRRRRVRRREDGGRHQPPATASSREYDADESDSEAELPAGYHQIAIQLLDLMHTLHTRAAHIFGWFGPAPVTPGGGGGGMSAAERKADQQQQQQQGGQEGGQRDEGPADSLWETGWCPLLQGIARLCCDSRKQVRASAVTYLQRSLLVHDLQALSPAEWEACFHKVLFPLLAKLLEPSPAAGLEETRIRAAALLCKVFLQHLTPLLSLHTFTALWLTILDFMDKYLKADRADLLHEAIPESMKNMLLVMETAGIFHTSDGYTELWVITWDRIDTFLPSLREQVFSNHPPSEINRLPSTAAAADGSTGVPTGRDQKTAPAPAGAGAAAGAAGGAPTPGAGAAGAAVVTDPSPMAPSMREIRPASPLHHEELMTAAPSVILGPPLPAEPSSASSASLASSLPAAGLCDSAVPVPVPVPVPAPGAPPQALAPSLAPSLAQAPVSLMSLSAQPPAASPVFLRPLPPPGLAAPVTPVTPVTPAAASAVPIPDPSQGPPAAATATASEPQPPPPTMVSAVPSDVTRQSAGGVMTSSESETGLPVFRMAAAEGADDFLGR